ncbi:MAG: VCBS repeat-containing protein, partial [Planctomycetes bacterium]|nr:VCBS repeat-containing protein [Planctomycetota bacterium]
MRHFVRLFFLSALIACLAIGAGCQRVPTSTSPPAQPAGPVRVPPANKPAPPDEPPSPILFSDVTPETGITWRQVSGMTAEKYFPTANGSGLAMLDFDGDGWLDLYIVTSCHLPIKRGSESPRNALYRNRRDGTFEDVSEASGLGFAGFGQGVAVGDVNNDGFPDVYLPCYGPNALFINNGDGTFREATAESGTGDRRWGVSAAFLDYDEDGCLDLYAANYGQWTVETNQPCGDERRKLRQYCSPESLTPELHILYHNEGNGTFREVTSELGIQRTDGRGQGVVAADVNGDGHIDLYVANDICPNFLFINNGKGGFTDETDISCAALNAIGKAEASMGVDAGDVFGTGRYALFVTNFEHEQNTLYENLGGNLFQDVSSTTGVAAGSLPYVGWGTALEDLDNDGWLDIFVANGHVDDNLAEFGRDAPHEEPALIWRNLGKRTFQLVRTGAGSYFATPHVSRGVAFGDLDNDGDIDLAICHKDARPTILRNDSCLREASRNNGWIQLRLMGTCQNRDAVGTAVEV